MCLVIHGCFVGILAFVWFVFSSVARVFILPFASNLDSGILFLFGGTSLSVLALYFWCGHVKRTGSSSYHGFRAWLAPPVLTLIKLWSSPYLGLWCNSRPLPKNKTKNEHVQRFLNKGGQLLAIVAPGVRLVAHEHSIAAWLEPTTLRKLLLSLLQ